MLLRRILNWGLGYALILLGILSVFLFGEKTIPAMNAEEFVYSFKKNYKVDINGAMYELAGFGIFEI